jgi:hypothetical protein
MNSEMWLSIEEFENYSVSTFGRVYSKKRKIFLKYGLDKNNYLIVHLYTKGKSSIKRIHRLVANAFIFNSLNKPQVNHKDGVKANNNVNNLEWATNKENHIHARDVLKIYNGYYPKPVIGTHIKTGQQIKFQSMNEAERNGFNHSDVSACCLGKQKTHKGYTWKLIKSSQ